MVDDWLSLPAEQPRSPYDRVDPVQQMLDEIDRAALATATHDAPPTEVVLRETPPGVDEKNKLVERVWAGLTPLQRQWLDTLELCEFNESKARRVLGKGAPAKTTIQGWKQQPDYVLMIKVKKVSRASELLDKNELVVKAGEIREQALEGKPILYQGVPTGFFENQPEVALRANEQLAKIGGHMKQDDAPVQGQGPALVIQVVQPGGSVVDVTPKGVTIDLPAPSGP